MGIPICGTHPSHGSYVPKLYPSISAWGWIEDKMQRPRKSNITTNLKLQTKQNEKDSLTAACLRSEGRSRPTEQIIRLRALRRIIALSRIFVSTEGHAPRPFGHVI